MVNLQAHQIPLADVLKSLAHETGIIIKSGDSLTDPISINLTSMSVEECIRRLLTNQNYALIYEKTNDGQFVPVELRIFGHGRLEPLANASAHLHDESAPIPSPDNHMKKYHKQWFERECSDDKNLSQQMSSVPVGNDDYEFGIQVKSISKNSTLQKIGLKEGDIINDVNGQPVKTGQEFIQALRTASKGQSIIRIERLTNNNFPDPIYIELH